MKGISFAIFFPYTEATITAKSVTSAHMRQIRELVFIMYAPFESCATLPTASFMAFPASERPIIATVGPITTGGISFESQLTPANLTVIAMMTYTSPAIAAPMMSPR